MDKVLKLFLQLQHISSLTGSIHWFVFWRIRRTDQRTSAIIYTYVCTYVFICVIMVPQSIVLWYDDWKPEQPIASQRLPKHRFPWQRIKQTHTRTFGRTDLSTDVGRNIRLRLRISSIIYSLENSVFSCGALTSEQRELKNLPTRKSEPSQSRRREDTRSSVRNGASLRQSLIVTCCNFKRCANKSNHTVQNSLLLVTEALTRDRI
jgi:hypothetical protein